MGHDQQRGAGPGDVLDHVQHFLHHFRVQRRRGLVEQQQLGLHGQGPRDGDALLLSARQLARPLVLVVSQAHAFQQGLGPRRGLGPGQATHAHRRQRHVPERAHVREQVELLEHHADLGAHARQAPVVAHRDAVDLDAAAIIGFQQVHAAHQRRLAGPGRADEGDDLATGHVQVDAVQRGEGAVVFSSRRRLAAGRVRGRRCVGVLRRGQGGMRTIGLPGGWRGSRWR